MTEKCEVDVKPPETSFEFICEWFEKAANQAQSQGRFDSARLWRDGLEHLKYYHSKCTKKESK